MSRLPSSGGDGEIGSGVWAGYCRQPLFRGRNRACDVADRVLFVRARVCFYGGSAPADRVGVDPEVFGKDGGTSG